MAKKSFTWHGLVSPEEAV